MNAPLSRGGRMTWPEHLLRDLRHACRALVGMPILASVVILSLGLGVGVNTAVFSWIQALTLRPLPGVAESGSFQLIEPRADAGSYPGTSWLEYRDLRDRLPSFRELLAFRMLALNLGDPGQTERGYAELVSGNYFPALGLEPALGRFLRADEAERPGTEPVVVISHDFWQARFAGAADVLGKHVRANGLDLTVIGVAPKDFQGTVLGLQFDLWVPATMAPVLVAGSRELEDRSQRGYSVMGRLRPGATRAQAQAELDAAMRRLARDYPETNAAIGASIRAFWEAPRGPQGMLLQGLAVLQAIMLLLLLAVCGNTANLLLARASARRREIGVRLALGAGPWGLVRLFAIENLVLALPGAALGALLAMWGTDALRAFRFTTAFPIRFQTGVDGAGLAFAIALGVGCALVFGLAPATQLARLDPQSALRSGHTMTSRSRLRGALVGVQVALALVVLITAAIFYGSFRETRSIDPGFRREGVLLTAYDLTSRQVSDDIARDFAKRLIEQVSRIPAVESAAIASAVPLDIHGLPLRSLTLEGRPSTSAVPDQALSITVTPGYFETMGIPIRAGSDFAALGDAAAAPQAIVNEEFARRYVGAGETLGRLVTIRGRSYTIVGIARNSLYESFGEAPIPFVYLSFRDRPSWIGQVHVRTRAGTEMLLAPEIRRAVRDLDPSLPVYDVRTLSEHVEMNLILRKIPARMFVVLGPLLLALAAVGIYAVVSYSVSRRRTEIGVRMALGATAARVIGELVRDSLRMVMAGALAGWLLVFLAYIHLAPGRRLDGAAFIGTPLVLLFFAAVACWLPVRRATRVDPMTALKPAEE